MPLIIPLLLLLTFTLLMGHIIRLLLHFELQLPPSWDDQSSLFLLMLKVAFVILKGFI